ncbi:FAD-binding protein [Bradyrhizobium sp. USDA 4353]
MNSVKSSCRGLFTNAIARVFDEDNRPIGSLYACGRATNSAMLGVHPSSGCNIGPALVFEFCAANTLDRGR